jgi:hypothetical protein
VVDIHKRRTEVWWRQIGYEVFVKSSTGERWFPLLAWPASDIAHIIRGGRLSR